MPGWGWTGEYAHVKFAQNKGGCVTSSTYTVDKCPINAERGKGLDIPKKLQTSYVHAVRVMSREYGLTVAGAAAMPLSTFEYFESLDIVLHELMGCTETAGPQATNRKGNLIQVNLGANY